VKVLFKKSFKVDDYAEMRLILNITSPANCYINLQYITLLRKTPMKPAQYTVCFAKHVEIKYNNRIICGYV